MELEKERTKQGARARILLGTLNVSVSEQSKDARFASTM